MTVKDFLKKQLLEFFLITTLADLAIYILGSIYNKGLTFSYEVLLTPILYGFAGSIPSWIMYSKKELTVKQYIIRSILHFIFLEILLIAITFGTTHLVKENTGMIISFAFSVFVVMILVNLIEWLLNKREAVNLTKDLQEYQKGYSEE